ncbi:hypothetical protein ACLBX9_15930 [Methylobacterium sp. A49B]
MDAFNPFKIAAFWTGMALGNPMLAQELAAEVWGTRPQPAPVPAEKAAIGMTRRVEDIQTRFSTEGLAEVNAAFAGRSFLGLAGDVAALRDAFDGAVEPPRWAISDPIVLEPGRIEELPAGFVVRSAGPSEIEVQTGPLPTPKPRKRKS